MDLLQVVQDVDVVSVYNIYTDGGCAAGPGPHHARPAHQPDLSQTQPQGRGGTETEATEDAEEILIIYFLLRIR